MEYSKYVDLMDEIIEMYPNDYEYLHKSIDDLLVWILEDLSEDTLIEEPIRKVIISIIDKRRDVKQAFGYRHSCS